MSIEFDDNILNKTPKDLNDKTGVFDSGVWRPYNTVDEALISPKLIPAYRHIGLTICVLKSGKPNEYWWRNGTTDLDLVLKITNEANIAPVLTNEYFTL